MGRPRRARARTRFLAGVLLAVVPAPASACGQDAGEAGGEDPLALTPFVYVSSIEPHAGGRPGLSRVLHVDARGRLQSTRESTDGRILSLQEARLPEGSFSAVLARVPELPDELVPPPGGLQDHSPARVAVAWSKPSGERDIRSFPARQPPPGVAALVEHVSLLRDEAQLAPAASGLYARAQRIAGFDVRIQTPDLVLDREAARAIGWLAQVLDQEMRLVRVGERGSRVVLAEGLELRGGRALHVQVGDHVYRLIAYVNSQEPDQEEPK